MSGDLFALLVVSGFISFCVGSGFLIKFMNFGNKLPRGYICIPKEAWDEQLEIERRMGEVGDSMQSALMDTLSDTEDEGQAKAVILAWKDLTRETRGEE